jgi:hypothetical protein
LSCPLDDQLPHLAGGSGVVRFLTCPSVDLTGATADVANPRHAATAPGHPKTITVREDDLLTVIHEFISDHLLGSHRRDLLAAHLTTTPDEDKAHRNEPKARLAARLHRIETAQNALVGELEIPPDPGDIAAVALRARIRARFAELETERAAGGDEDDLEGARAVHALDPVQFDVAGGGRAADPGERAARVQPGQGLRDQGDHLLGPDDA